MKEKEISRRGFLSIALAAGGAIAIGETMFVGLRFLAPKAPSVAFGGEFNLGPYNQFPLASVTPVEAGRFYLVRLQDGGFLAVYRRCTHLGCSVPYDPSIQQFVCPCHGSEFTMEGDVLTAPAPRPLDIFPLSITETGEMVIDTSNPIERGQTDPSQIVYA